MQAGEEFTLSVDGVTNPVSLRPSTSFSKIILIDSKENQNMASFKEPVSVFTRYLSLLPVDSAELIQGSLDENDINIYKLSFDTNNKLPRSASVQVKVPKTLP